MELKLVYKETEIGMIPEDWDRKPIGSFSAFVTKGATPTTYGFEWENDGVLFLRSECVSEDGLDLRQSMFISERAHAALSRGEVRSGDILITITGNVGRVVLLGLDFRFGNINQHIARIRVKDPSVLSEFVFHYLSQPKVRVFYNSITTGQAYPQISLKQVRETLVPLPPLPEQRAIATALGDVDALIASLEKLIAKKRDLKQAAMQQLLTGQTRLPGFSGKWEVVSLDQIVIRSTGFWGKQERGDRHPRLACIIRAGDISPDGRLTDTAPRFLSEAEFSKAQCKLDDLIITTSGNGLGKVWWCDGRLDLAASNFVSILRPHCDKTKGRFLYYVLQSDESQRLLIEHTATSAYPNLRRTYFSARWILLPPLLEQIAIATVLSDMDVEIAALEQRYAKTRALKQGMMQELLTGRTRLV